MLVIAEIGTSHEGSIEKAKKMIDAACDSGANAVKFQWVYAEEILHPNTGFVNLPTGKISLYDRFKSLECSKDFYLELKNYSHSKNVKFICSPFGTKSLEELVEIQPDYIKIASPELNHFPLLIKLSEIRKNQKNPVPVIISSGVSKIGDIEKTLEILGTDGISLLHCITSYPAPESEYNLKLIENLHNILGIDCGLSDHSLDPVLVPCLSVAFGGKIIEKHITLSRKTSGLDDPVALEPEQFALMVHCVNQSLACINHYGKSKGKEEIIRQMKDSYGEEKVLSAIGDGIKKLAPSEVQNYGKTNRSLHFVNDLKAGTKISSEDIKVLRTEKNLSVGISSEFYDLLIGKTLTENVKAGEGVLFEHFMLK